MTIDSLRRRVRLGAACAASLIAALFSVTYAAPVHASGLGEIGQVGAFGSGEGEFEYPIDVAADSGEKNDVFVIDSPEGFEPTEVRIQKFEPPLRQSSKPVATAKVPMEAGQYIAAIAVDPALDRLYVLKSTEGSTSQWMASEIDSYSTGALSTESVFYKFQTTPAGLPEPRGMALEPGTNNLLVLGTGERGEQTVIQRIVGDGGTGSLGEQFGDGTDAITHGSAAGAMAAGPDGAIYVEGNAGFIPGGYPGIDELSTEPPHSLEDPGIRTVHSEDGEELNREVPRLTGGARRQFFESGQGEQLAVSPEGSALYAATVSTAEGFPGTEGDYEVRGMSPGSGAQEVLYGGGETSGDPEAPCHIASEAIAIAAGTGGIVYALDKGVTVYHGPSSTYGFHLIEFGPGGSGCPVPQTSVSAPTRVQKGEPVTFTASKAELQGAEPSEVTWEFAGPEDATKVSEGCPTEPSKCLSTSLRFLKAGDYTVKMTMATTGGFGPPPPVTQNLEVAAPSPTASFEASVSSAKPGETVTFKGAESLDPAGGACSQQSGCTPTHTLKSYEWSFGDGESETTSTPEYSRAFANASTTARSETATLTVINEEGVESMPVTESLTIEGTPGVVSPGPGPSIGPPPVVAPTPDRSPTNVDPSIVTGNGLITLTVSCPATKVSCGGTAQLKATPKATKAHRKPAAVVVGQGSFSVTSGGKQKLTIRLSASGMALLKKEKVLRVEVIVVSHDSFGDPETRTLTITLRAPKAKHRG
jgi:PKD repeat protein